MPGEIPLTYSQSGVNYELMDPFKIQCQQGATTTGKNIERFKRYGLDVKEISQSRGESAFKIAIISQTGIKMSIIGIEEGLGSKNVVAHHYRESLQHRQLQLANDVSRVLGKSLYRGIGLDNASASLNDLATSGATPLMFNLHVAADSSDWFTDEVRNADLIAGTVEACNQTRCVWGGGESPTLRDVISPGMDLLASSAIGLEFPDINKPLTEDNIEEGQRILFLLTPGVNINGLTLLRRGLLERIATRFGYEGSTRLLDAYSQDIGNGRPYGEAILEPTPLYARVVDAIHEEGLPIESAGLISGHSFRKIMRARKDLTYVIQRIPDPPQIFKFIQEISGMNDNQIYADYNMGAGFFLFMAPKHLDRSIEIAQRLGYGAMDAGYIETGPRRVVIEPLGIEYKGETLQIR